MNFMTFGLKNEPNSIAGKLLHDTQVTYKARGPRYFKQLCHLYTDLVLIKVLPCLPSVILIMNLWLIKHNNLEHYFSQKQHMIFTVCMFMYEIKD